MAGRRGSRAIGNPDGTPRLDIVDAGAPATEAEAEIKVEGELSDDEIIRRLSEKETRPQGKDNSSFLDTEDAEPVEAPQQSYYGKKRTRKEAEERAGWLLMILEGAAILALGEEARLLPHEKRMIVDPLARMMMRLDPGVAEAIDKWTDPILLLFGFLTVGSRWMTIAQEKNEGNDDGPPRRKPPSNAPSPGPNGNGRTVDEVLSTDEVSFLKAGPGDAITSQVNPTGMIE